MKELKRYKEELAVVGLLSLVLLAIRWVSATVWPTTGQYDLAAQTETVFFVVLRLVLYSLAAWLGLRVVAPKVYMHLKHRLIDRFDLLQPAEQNSFALRFYAILFFGLIGLALAGAPVVPAAPAVRTCVVAAAMSDVGVREATGRNDGTEVERYLAHVGLGKGHAWCAAFVSYHLSTCRVQNPKSAWSPAFAATADRVWTPRKASRSPLPGDVFSVYYPSLKRVGHVGIVAGTDGRYITTIEGNTSGPGSREGDGVYARKRELIKVHAITNYIQDHQAVPARAADLAPVRAGRMQAQAATDTEHVRRAAHREGGWRVAARYRADRSCGTGAWQCATAAARTRPAGANRALGQGVEFGSCEQRQHHPCGWLRYRAIQGHAVRPVEPGAQPAGADRCAHRTGDGGGDRNATVGVVGAGRGLGMAGKTAVATVAKVPVLTQCRQA